MAVRLNFRPDRIPNIGGGGGAAIPEDYSISRASISGALIAGDDYSQYSPGTKLGSGFGLGFDMHPNAPVSQLSTAVDPTAQWRHETISDPIFGVVHRGWHEDEFDLNGNRVSQSAPGEHSDTAERLRSVGAHTVNRWSRQTFFLQPTVSSGGLDDANAVSAGFTTARVLLPGTADTPYGGNKSWKWIFMPGHRWHTWEVLSLWVQTEDIDVPADGGIMTGYANTINLPQNDAGELWRTNDTILRGDQTLSKAGVPMWQSNEWWEVIHNWKKLSATEVMYRSWARQISEGGGTSLLSVPYFPVVFPGQSNALAKKGSRFQGCANLADQFSGGNVRSTRNKNAGAGYGFSSWTLWGPWEMIDGDIVPDPYGLASDGDENDSNWP